MLADGTAQIG